MISTTFQVAKNTYYNKKYIIKSTKTKLPFALLFRQKKSYKATDKKSILNKVVDRLTIQYTRYAMLPRERWFCLDLDVTTRLRLATNTQWAN